MKKLIMLTLCAALITAPLRGFAAGPSDWAKTDIDEAVKRRLVPEEIDTYYTEDICRDDVCALIDALLSKNNYERMLPYENPFIDTNDEAVLSLYELDIIDGKSENAFAPEDYITREEFAKILANTYVFLSGEKIPGADAEYTDLDTVSDWAAESVGGVTALGLLKGDGNGQFRPQSNITAEEAIVTVLRLNKLNLTSSLKINHISIGDFYAFIESGCDFSAVDYTGAVTYRNSPIEAVPVNIGTSAILYEHIYGMLSHLKISSDLSEYDPEINLLDYEIFEITPSDRYDSLPVFVWLDTSKGFLVEDAVTEKVYATDEFKDVFSEKRATVYCNNKEIKTNYASVVYNDAFLSVKSLMEGIGITADETSGDITFKSGDKVLRITTDQKNQISGYDVVNDKNYIIDGGGMLIGGSYENLDDKMVLYDSQIASILRFFYDNVTIKIEGEKIIINCV